MLDPEMVNELRDYLRVGLALEDVASLLEEGLQFLVVGYDTFAKECGFVEKSLNCLYHCIQLKSLLEEHSKNLFVTR